MSWRLKQGDKKTSGSKSHKSHFHADANYSGILLIGPPRVHASVCIITQAWPSHNLLALVAKRGGHGPRRSLCGPQKMGMRVETSGANEITNNAINFTVAISQ